MKALVGVVLSAIVYWKGAPMPVLPTDAAQYVEIRGGGLEYRWPCRQPDGSLLWCFEVVPWAR